MYKKLSLRELSEFLGRTKATLSHHLKKIKNTGILKITKEDARGSIDANIYELQPEFYEMLNYDFNKLKFFKPEELKELFHFNILKDKGNFEVLKSIVDRANQFYEDFDQFKSETEKISFKDIKKFYFNNLINYNIWFLSEEGRKKLEEINKDYQAKINDLVKQEDFKKKIIKKPFLLLNFLVPLKNIIEYDQRDKKFLDFFQVFD